MFALERKGKVQTMEVVTCSYLENKITKHVSFSVSSNNTEVSWSCHSGSCLLLQIRKLRTVLPAVTSSG
jgi:hypothetical protein